MERERLSLWENAFQTQFQRKTITEAIERNEDEEVKIRVMRRDWRNKLEVYKTLRQRARKQKQGGQLMMKQPDYWLEQCKRAISIQYTSGAVESSCV